MIKAGQMYEMINYVAGPNCDNNYCIVEKILDNGNIVFSTCHSRSPDTGWPQEGFLKTYQLKGATNVT